MDESWDDPCWSPALLRARPKELQKTQVEEDAKAVRAENQSLREQLANEQRVWSGMSKG